MALRAEQVQVTRYKVCHAVSALASHVLDPKTQEAGWPAIGLVLSELFEGPSGDTQGEARLAHLADLPSTRRRSGIARAAVTGGRSAFMRAGRWTRHVTRHLESCYAVTSGRALFSQHPSSLRSSACMRGLIKCVR